MTQIPRAKLDTTMEVARYHSLRANENKKDHQNSP
jgi:hypothetical protein